MKKSFGIGIGLVAFIVALGVYTHTTTLPADTQAREAVVESASTIQSSDTAPNNHPLADSGVNVKQTAKEMATPSTHNEILVVDTDHGVKFIDTSDTEEPALEKIKVLFPQLKDQIESYQSEVKQQIQQVDNYRKMVEERNRLAKEEGYVPENLSLKLTQQQEVLLAAAERLGKEGLVINAAIREQAAKIKR